MYGWMSEMPPSSYHISSIDIENFRQYRSARIKFSRDPDKMFTIIRGVNGAGKTNIMNAITWCLYGTEKHLGSDEKDLPITNTHALREKSNGLVTMRVSIKLADERGDRYLIERQLSLYNGGQTDVTGFDDKVRAVIPSMSTPAISKNLQVYDPDKGGWKSTEYFDMVVNSLLPEDLATYFLFDGEKLEDFFEHIDNTKKGIKDVSQIGIADQAMGTLDSLKVQLRRNAKGLDPQVDTYMQRLEEQEKLVKEINGNIKRIRLEQENASTRVNEIEQSIIEFGGDVSTYQTEARALMAEIDRIKMQYDEAASEKANYVLEHLFGTQLFNNIAYTVKSIKAKSSEGILPPKIQETFIRELLETGKCICGNDISADPHSREMVERLLNKAKYSEISDICTELKYELEPMLKPESILEALNEKDRKIMSLKEDMQRRQNHHKELETRISRADNMSIAELTDEKSQLLARKDKLSEDLGANKARLKNAENEQGRLQTEYERATRNDRKYRHIRKQQEFCERAHQSLMKVRDGLLDHVRTTVRKHTREYFLQLLWKKDTYKDVTIDEDYNITTQHIDGYDVRAGLSKGEKLVLALSFMAALRKVTGFGFPLLIDTPLGRVSGEPRHNIARLLPEFLKNNQVTLLVTDAEYQTPILDDDNNTRFPSVRNTISRRVGVEYDIVFENGESRVVMH